jgi:hypothetical protein
MSFLHLAILLATSNDASNGSPVTIVIFVIARFCY